MKQRSKSTAAPTAIALLAVILLLTACQATAVVPNRHLTHPKPFHACETSLATATPQGEHVVPDPLQPFRFPRLDVVGERGLALIGDRFSPELRVVRLPEGRLVGRVIVDGTLIRGFLLPCGRHLLTVVQTEGGDAQKVELRALPSGEVEAAVKISPLPTSNIERSDDGHFLVFTSQRSEELPAPDGIAVFDVRLGQVLWTRSDPLPCNLFDFPRADVLRSRHIADCRWIDGAEVVGFTEWDVITGEELRAIRTRELFGHFAVSPDGTAWVGVKGRAVERRSSEGTPVWVVTADHLPGGWSGEVVAVELVRTPGGDRVVVVNSECDYFVLDADDGDVLSGRLHASREVKDVSHVVRGSTVLLSCTSRDDTGGLRQDFHSVDTAALERGDFFWPSAAAAGEER